MPLFIALAVIGFVFASLFLFLMCPWPTTPDGTEYGVTFSRSYATHDLNLDASAVLRAALDDLKIRRFRIPAYWKELETEQGTWTFKGLDADIAEIGKRGGTVVLAVGQKLPRWPECWTPAWTETLTQAQKRAAVLGYVRTVIEHYKNNPTVVSWQIENEARFAYGVCPKPDKDLIRQEIALARTLDSRPISSTESGELSFWTTFTGQVDAIGVSVYRRVVNPLLGVWDYWFFPPQFYARKAQILRLFGVPHIYVSEFQMEPWSLKALTETPVDVQLTTMDIRQMRKNFDYASRMGISPIDFWGVEWWYWMRETQGHPELWAEARKFYSGPRP